MPILFTFEEWVKVSGKRDEGKATVDMLALHNKRGRQARAEGSGGSHIS